MNAGERDGVANALLDLMRQRVGDASAGDRTAIAAVLAGKVIAAVTTAQDRAIAVKAFMGTMNAQLTLESAGEHRVASPVGRFGMEDE